MPRKRQPAPFDGALLINKPRGMTSHDVVDAVRRALGFRQVGHLGTLDPLATGVLALLLGKATRLLQFYIGRRKRYDFAVRFGFATDTYDSDGAAQGPDTAPALARESIEPCLARFIGKFSQMPPPFSAKKIAGRPAYELARQRQPVELQPVAVEVFDLRLLSMAGSVARFSVECASGTYVRSLAHDLGKLCLPGPDGMGPGAHLVEITRTAVGEFALDQCSTLEDLTAAAQAGRAADVIVPMERLLPELPSATVMPAVEHRVRHGANFTLPLAHIQPGRLVLPQGATSQLDSGDWKPARLRIFSPQGRLIALAEAVVPRTYRPIVVFDPA
jgi:tRNA pseudouridine55 synthase